MIQAAAKVVITGIFLLTAVTDCVLLLCRLRCGVVRGLHICSFQTAQSVLKRMTTEALAWGVLLAATFSVRCRVPHLVNNQLDVLYNYFSYICLFQFCTCFEQPSAHHQESHLYQYDLWYMSLYVGDRVVCRFRWNIRRVSCINTTSGICHCT